MPCLCLGNAGFVIQRIFERQRERADRPIRALLRQAQNCAGIDAATEIGRDLDIGDQSLSNGIEQSLAEFFDDLGFTSRISSSSVRPLGSPNPNTDRCERRRAWLSRNNPEGRY